jgi:hypothetical protein
MGNRSADCEVELGHRRTCPATHTPAQMVKYCFGTSQTVIADLKPALQLFDATEGNLKKLMTYGAESRPICPEVRHSMGPPEYDDLGFAFRQILTALPAIDEFRVEDRLLEI